MEAMIDHLRETGVPGVAFGVAAANARAIGFYEHMGFKRLPEYEQDAPVFGMKF